MQTAELETLTQLLEHELCIATQLRRIEAELDTLARQRTDLRRSRSPFVFFVKPDVKRKFHDSQQQLDEAETALRAAAAKTSKALRVVQTTLRPLLEQYVNRESAEFARRHALLAEIGRAESTAAEYVERLKAVAREVRNARLAVQRAEPGNERNIDFRTALQELFAVATVTDGLAETLQRHDETVTSLSGTIYAEVTLFPVPVTHLESWARKLELLDRSALLQQLTNKEDSVRAVIKDGGAMLAAEYKATRDHVDYFATRYLETYWQQLRDHTAQQLGPVPLSSDVCETLIARYLTPPDPRRAGLPNPYFCER